uniref:Secreted protein n=1 Tax=Steinernema glaseri TaxID=37863 RepID=A0A1I7YFH7_9BILA
MTKQKTFPMTVFALLGMKSTLSTSNVSPGIQKEWYPRDDVVPTPPARRSSWTHQRWNGLQQQDPEFRCLIEFNVLLQPTWKPAMTKQCMWRASETLESQHRHRPTRPRDR